MTSTRRARPVDADDIKRAILGDRFLDLFEALGFPRPRKRVVPCPLHNDRHGASLSLTPADGVWNCHAGCGGGDQIALVMKARACDFKSALVWLNEWTGGARVEAPAPMSAPQRGADAGPFLRALWDIVATDEVGWSPVVETYIAESRGVEPDAAFALGCRDWSVHRAELARLVDATATEVLEAAGLVREGKLWAPLRGCLRGDPGAAGVAVPAWRLGASYPERWRWRLCSPWRGPGGLLKSVACFSGGPGPGADFLGAGLPPRPAGAEIRVAPIGSVPLLILTEGEPDWWSVVQAVDGAASVVAVCGGATRWRDTWPSIAALKARGVQRIGVVVHAGKSDGEGRGHGEKFADTVADACVQGGLICDAQNPREGYDLNDRHKAGELRAWLADMIAGAV